MKTRTGWAVALVLTTGLAGCEETRLPTSPSTRMSTTTPAVALNPAPVVPAPPEGGAVAIKGTVNDSATRSLAGATVELLDGPQAGTTTISDERGQFSFLAVIDDTTRFRASKDGHTTAIATIMPFCDRCNPQRWVHFYLKVIEPTAALGGDYKLDFIADSRCADFPPELRSRSYGVTVSLADSNWWGVPAHSETTFKVSPRGGEFPAGLNYFYLFVAGNHVAIALGDHSDPGVTERVAHDTYFAFNGWAEVSVDTPVSRISTPFRGWIDHCINPQMGERYDCQQGPPALLRRCDATHHQLILTRQ